MLESSMTGRAKDHFQICPASVVPLTAVVLAHPAALIKASIIFLKLEATEAHAGLSNKATEKSATLAIGNVKALFSLAPPHPQALHDRR